MDFSVMAYLAYEKESGQKTKRGRRHNVSIIVPDPKTPASGLIPSPGSVFDYSLDDSCPGDHQA